MTSGHSHLNERYGVRNPASQKRAQRIAFIAALAVFFAATLWVAWAFISGNQIKANTVKYQHLGPSQIAVEFSVTMPPGTSAKCGVEAFNKNRGQVGFTVVDIPASNERITVHRATVTTQQPAVSGAVKTCEISQ